MKVTINGEHTELDHPLSIMALLGKLSIEPKKIAIERNLEIVPKSAYDATMVSDGDRLEIVQFVGGG